MKDLVLAITGASGSALALKMLELLEKLQSHRVHLIVSDAANITLFQECGLKIQDLEKRVHAVYSNCDIGAALASGSFRHQGMLIVPCSIKTLSAVSNSFASDLISRAADVCLKEAYPLLLAVRETPLHTGHLELMTHASRLGAIIMPPLPAFYANPSSMDQALEHLAARMLARVGIENNFYPRWKNED